MWLAAAWPGTEMPYSVSVPITRRTPTRPPPRPPPRFRVGYAGTVSDQPRRHGPTRLHKQAGERQGRRSRDQPRLQVLAGVGDRVDGAAGVGALAGHERADVDDPLALLAGDPCPVVGVGGVRKVLVFLELVHAGGHQVLQPQPLLTQLEEVLDRHLLGASHDALD